jgi:hypothetical protein
MKDYCKRHGIKQTFSSSYSPRSNGLVEHKVRYFKHIVKKYTVGRPSVQLKPILNEIAFAMNTNLDKGIGTSPYEVLFGYMPQTPLDVALQTDKLPGDTQYTDDWQNNIDIRRAVMDTARKVNATSTKFHFDKGIVESPFFQRGDLVKVRTPRHLLDSDNSRKSRILFGGPYRVLEIYGRDVMLITLDEPGVVLPDLINARRLVKIEGYSNTIPYDKITTEGVTIEKGMDTPDPENLVAACISSKVVDPLKFADEIVDEHSLCPQTFVGEGVVSVSFALTKLTRIKNGNRELLGIPLSHFSTCVWFRNDVVTDKQALQQMGHLGESVLRSVKSRR